MANFHATLRFAGAPFAFNYKQKNAILMTLMTILNEFSFIVIKMIAFISIDRTV